MPLPVCFRAGLMVMRFLLFAGATSFFFAGTSGHADNASGDYLVDMWETEDTHTEDNLPNSTVTCITQTRDRYLWVGTYDGLARFDGVRFVTYEHLSNPEIGNSRIQALYVDAAGTLWINTFRGGLTSYRSDRQPKFRMEWPDDPLWPDLHTTLAWSSSNCVVFVTQFGEVLQRIEGGTNTLSKIATPPGGARLIFQCAGGDGRLWFLTREGHIIRFAGGEWEELPDGGGLGNKRVRTLVTDHKGRIWAGAENEIACWNGKRFETMTPTNGEANLDPLLLFPTRSGAIWVLAGERLRKMEGRQWTTEATEWRGLLGWASTRPMGAHEDRDGGIWFNHYGNGLFHITPDGRYHHLTMQDELPGDRVGAWFQGHDGSIWIGMDRGGLARVRDRHFHVIGQAEGLLARTTLSVCEDRGGSIWIGTGGAGVYRWNGNQLDRFAIGNYAATNFVFSICPRSDGSIWLSAGEGEDLLVLRDGKFQRPPWDLHGVKSILEDRSGRVWMGTKSSLAWWSPGARRLFGPNDGVGFAAIRTLVEAPDGTIWGGADDGTLYRCEQDRLQAFRPTDELAGQPIWTLWSDHDGVLWASTSRGGLLRFKDGKFSRLTTKQGLPTDVISQILEDKRGRLWLGTHQGIFWVSKTVLNACADGKLSRVDYVTYGRRNGLPTLECSDGYQPACWRGNDGRLWFTTVKGVVSLNPEELAVHTVPPLVVVEELKVDRKGIELNSGKKVVIPPGHKQFEFRFTALGFDKTRFRYRIDKLDTDWVEAGTRRTAQYGNLPAGDYHFQVIACDSEGSWSQSGADLAFVVQPFFYETRSFLVFASVFVLGSVALIVRNAAARKYQRKLERLEQQHAVERDRARIAKDIHDDIGAGLTQITLLSELARREPEQAGGHLDRISDSARQLTRAMDEIVWAVDPQHDTFSGLIDYVSAFAEDFLRMAGIRCRMDLPTALPELQVDAEARYHLFLALKEALNNIVKHARATEVWLRLHIEPTAFTLVVEDNGQGLPANGSTGTSTIGGDRIASGSGLSNLETRLAAIGGRCVVHSTPHQGTRVEMTLAMNGGVSPIVVIGGNGANH